MSLFELIFGKNKKLLEHKKIKAYQQKMRDEKRCDQCVYPWHDGICECGKWGDEQEEILVLAFDLMDEGWE